MLYGISGDKNYITSIIYKLKNSCYSDDMKSRDAKDWRKGKEMTAVRFAYYLNSESHYESLVEYKYEEWSGFMRSFKVKQRQRITVDLKL